MRRLIHFLVHAANLTGVCFWTAVAKSKFRLLGCCYGRGLRVTGPLRLSIHPEGVLRIGEFVTINASWRHNPVGSSQHCTIWVSKGANLEVGDNVGMSHVEIVCTRAIRIGRRSKIGGGASIYDSDFHALSAGLRALAGNAGAGSSPVSLGEDTFLGAHCIVLKGVSIGDRSIIGAGSVVVKTVASDQVWAGVPARFLREAR